MIFDFNSDRNFSPDELIELQEEIVQGKVSQSVLDWLGVSLDKRIERLERIAGNNVAAPGIPDSYFRGQMAAIRELRLWKQNLVLKKERGNRIAEFFRKLRTRSNQSEVMKK